MTSATVALLAVIALEQTPAPGPAPPSGGRIHLQAAVLFATQPAGEPFHRFSPPLSGHALSVIGSLGYSFTPEIAVEGEFVFGGDISAPQQFSYNWREEFTAYTRDLLFNALVRWTPRGMPYLHVLAGGGVARTTVGERDKVRIDNLYPGQRRQNVSDWSESYTGLTLTMGVDATIPMSRRVAFVPTFRLRTLERDKEQLGQYLGAGSLLYQAGAGIRATF